MDKRAKIQTLQKNSAVVDLTLFHDIVMEQFKGVSEEGRNRLSSKFENGFMNVLQQCYGDKKVEASEVYMKYMLNKGNVHISKTKWKTLDEFIRYQGRVGRFLVDYSSKIWYIKNLQKVEATAHVLPSRPKPRYVDRNFKGQSDRNGLTPTKEDMCNNTPQCDENTRVPPIMNTGSEPLKQNNQKWTLKREKVVFKMSPRRSPYKKDQRTSLSQKSLSNHVKPNSNRKSALAEIMEEEEKEKERMNRRDSWLRAGIVVTIITDKYGRSNHRKKCRIIGLLSPYTGVAHVLCNDNILMVDQKYLMTLVPEVGDVTCIVNGAYRGERGVIERISTGQNAKPVCRVRLRGSPPQWSFGVCREGRLFYAD
ncbi:DNA/RNA-binding protein KIN17-like [Haliotis rubra]|uniref:DNA/RNA-binding protein KIN17-like n=1 Tax=Haliotis rubra TaxID=36100 RepID=UPI001EE60137|nr:DNA/RNA-binding protein KIN17-like [Haliotis rubra]